MNDRLRLILFLHCPFGVFELKTAFLFFQTWLKKRGIALCSNVSADTTHLLCCQNCHFQLQSPSNTYRFKIDISEVISPDEYLVQLLEIQQSDGNWTPYSRISANCLVKVRLMDIFPILKNNWDSNDRKRIDIEISDPFKLYAFEAEGVHFEKGFFFARNITVHDTESNDSFTLTDWMLKAGMIQMDQQFTTSPKQTPMKPALPESNACFGDDDDGL